MENEALCPVCSESITIDVNKIFADHGHLSTGDCSGSGKVAKQPFEVYDPESDPKKPPAVEEWEKTKASIRCKCNDPWRMGCTNWDAEEIRINGQEACACRCHRTKS